MKPSRKQIIGFLLSNDARYRSAERNQLTKKIMKTLRREQSKTYWSYYGVLAAMISLYLLVFGGLLLDVESDNLTAYLWLLGAITAISLPAVIYTTFKVFDTYFENYPEDFPKN